MRTRRRRRPAPPRWGRWPRPPRMRMRPKTTLMLQKRPSPRVAAAPSPAARELCVGGRRGRDPCNATRARCRPSADHPRATCFWTLPNRTSSRTPLSARSSSCTQRTRRAPRTTLRSSVVTRSTSTRRFIASSRTLWSRAATWSTKMARAPTRCAWGEGSTFADEAFVHAHDRPGLLSMANSGPNTNGSQFFITTAPAPHLDGKHVVFGRVVEGIEHIHDVEREVTDPNDRPIRRCYVMNCGVTDKPTASTYRWRAPAADADGPAPDASRGAGAADVQQRRRRWRQRDAGRRAHRAGTVPIVSNSYFLKK